MDRDSLLRSMFDVGGFGLEVGPSYNPLLPKKLGYKVETVDYATAADLKEKYKNDRTIDIGNIEEVDYLSDGGSLVDLIGATHRYDYIVASHVIEHVTDIVTFLKDCEQLLKPDGLLVMAVPDKRYCLDALRPVSTVGSAIQTYFERPSRHSPGAVFDHVSLVSARDGRTFWLDSALDGLQLIHSTSEARGVIEEAKSKGKYIDIHRWQFTPEYFRYFIKMLGDTGYTDFKEAEFHKNTEIGVHLHEFYISLSRSGRGPQASSLELLKAAHEELRAITVSAPPSSLQKEVAVLEGEVAELRQQLSTAKAETAALLGSTSWRVTKPLRGIKRALSR